MLTMSLINYQILLENSKWLYIVSVLSLLAVAIVGFGSMIVMAGSNTLIQTIVDEDKRGRVMSFVVMAFGDSRGHCAGVSQVQLIRRPLRPERGAHAQPICSSCR